MPNITIVLHKKISMNNNDGRVRLAADIYEVNFPPFSLTAFQSTKDKSCK